MEELKSAQTMVRAERAVQLMGNKSPQFIRTRGLYMVDTRAYLVDFFERSRDYLAEFGVIAGYRDALPSEIYYSYIILLPYYCFLRAVEWRACALSDIVPLSRALLALLRDIRQFLLTDPLREIFHELHIRFPARLMVNNRDDPIAAYSVTLQGRHEIRELER
jgi:hypothetical protein